jgi:hypothetical protein
MIPIRLNASCQFTEPAAAVRSPRASVEGEQDMAALEEFRERAYDAFLVGQLEGWRELKVRMIGHQNSFTSTISPASTMSV